MNVYLCPFSGPDPLLGTRATERRKRLIPTSGSFHFSRENRLRPKSPECTAATGQPGSSGLSHRPDVGNQRDVSWRWRHFNQILWEKLSRQGAEVVLSNSPEFPAVTSVLPGEQVRCSGKLGPMGTWMLQDTRGLYYLAKELELSL